MKGLQVLFDWTAKLAYLNILWILFSILGLVFFGVGPATVSVFTVMRKLLGGESDVSIWKLFIKTYKQNFWHANGLMLVIVPICIFIYIDFRLIQMLPNSFLIDRIVFPGVIILSLLTIVSISYLFAVYVHFDVSFFMNFKYALMIAGIYPLSTLLILFGLFVFSFVFLLFRFVRSEEHTFELQSRVYL